MKKIIIFACEKDSNKIFKYITKDCKNSLIFYDKKANEFFFKQKSNQKIEIVISKISFDEELIENIKYILKHHMKR